MMILMAVGMGSRATICPDIVLFFRLLLKEALFVLVEVIFLYPMMVGMYMEFLNFSSALHSILFGESHVKATFG